MEELLAGMEEAQAAGKLDEFVDLDRRFHATLYGCSGFTRACEMVERLRDSCDRYVRYYAAHQAGAAKSIDQHRSLLKACRGRSRTRVRRLTEEHIVHAKKALMEMATGAPGEAS
jgi:DNA-binding GntR family transcriptional regulator